MEHEAAASSAPPAAAGRGRGDKTAHGNSWYPSNVGEAERRLDQYCRQDTATTPIVKRGNR